MNRAVWLAATITCSTLSGCVVGRPDYVEAGGTYPAADPYAEVYVNAEPPAPVAEYRAYPPGPGYAWIDGYWDWSGYDWYWVRGYWAPARPDYYYVRPTYVIVNGRHVYRRGYWSGGDGR